MDETETNTPAGPRVRQVPDGDNRERLICPDCGFINYENPLMVVGAVVTYNDQFLLCKRAIEPRLGYWTIPAGFMELGETPLEGARREAWEEACADIRIDSLLAVYSIPRISQVQMIYRATLATPDFESGPESQEVALFNWDDIPWDSLAFPSVHWALNQHRELQGEASYQPRTNPPGEFGNL